MGRHGAAVPAALFATGSFFVCLLAAPMAHATDDVDIAAAAEFDEGHEAFLSGDYARAARAFERAYARKPHRDALWNAARSRHRAGDLAAAANLYARYLEEAPATAPDRDKAAAALLELRGSVARLEVHATAGIVDVRVDGTALVGTEKYVDPGEHLVEATGTTAAAEPAAIRKIALAERGESVHVTLEAPTVASRVDGPRSEAASLDAKVAKPRPFAVPWTVVAIGAVATAATAAVTVWSGIDTAQQKDRFDASRSQLDLDDGRARQTRTNVLLGVTLALAAATGIAGVLVDWRGAPAGSVALHVGPAHLDMLGCF